MQNNLPTLEKLIKHLQNVPYLASKNIYRVTAYFLQADKKTVEQICKAIIDAREKITQCNICFNWKEGAGNCSICTQVNRNKTIVCVVESWHEMLAIEKAGGYLGVYHILGGALSPLEGVGPEDLSISELLARIETSLKSEEPIKELIFATNPTPQGEATAAFIASKLKGTNVQGKPILISKLASGVPIGSTLEYMDRVTIFKALSGRRPF